MEYDVWRTFRWGYFIRYVIILTVRVCAISWLSTGSPSVTVLSPSLYKIALIQPPSPPLLLISLIITSTIVTYSFTSAHPILAPWVIETQCQWWFVRCADRRGSEYGLRLNSCRDNRCVSVLTVSVCLSQYCLNILWFSFNVCVKVYGSVSPCVYTRGTPTIHSHYTHNTLTHRKYCITFPCIYLRQFVTVPCLDCEGYRGHCYWDRLKVV